MPVLPLLAINAILMMAVAAGLARFSPWPPQAIAHVAFALGILPLILAAMAYFIPVLTRSGSTTHRGLKLVPLAAWLAGLSLIAGLSGTLPLTATSHAAFALAGSALLTMLGWCRHRARKMVGKPHPGYAWYIAALICLGLALLAVPLMTVWPEHRAALRLFHLHLNLLGFVGLTAIGTLQVLLPTAAGRPDPQVATRLARDLKYAISGVLLIALGAGWLRPLAIIGTGLLLIAPLRMLQGWWQTNRAQILQAHGTPASLASAGIGLILLLLLGAAHGLHGLNELHGLNGQNALVGYVAAFLLPLVSGAAAQLLPTWRKPGPQREWHAQQRAALGWLGGVRTWLMATGGVLLACGVPEGSWLVQGGGGLMLLAALRALR